MCGVSLEGGGWGGKEGGRQGGEERKKGGGGVAMEKGVGGESKGRNGWE